MIGTEVLAQEKPRAVRPVSHPQSHNFRSHLQTATIRRALDDLHPLTGNGESPVFTPGGGQELLEGIHAVGFA